VFAASERKKKKCKERVIWKAIVRDVQCSPDATKWYLGLRFILLILSTTQVS
jgi:hypothetical protein